MTNAYQVSIAARQLLEGYAAAMQPLCRREGLAPNGVDILLFLANNPGLDTARDVCTYRGLKPGIVSFHVEKLVQEGYLLRQPAPGDRRKCRLVCTEKAGPVVQQGRELQETFSAAWPGAWSRRTWRPSDAAWRASAGIYPK